MNPQSYQPNEPQQDDGPADASQLFQSTASTPPPVYETAPEKRKIPGKIKLIIALLAILILTLGASVLFPAKKKTADQSTASTADTSSTASKQPTSSGSGKSYALSQSIKLSKSPVWDFPDSYSDWKSDKTPRAGYSQYEQWIKGSDKTYTFTAQPVYTQGGSKDSDNTVSAADNYITTLKKTLAVPTSVTSSTGKVAIKGGGQLEFAQRDFVYSAAGKLYKGRVLMRTMDGYTVSIQLGAQAADFSDSEWKSLLGKTSLELAQL